MSYFNSKEEWEEFQSDIATVCVDDTLDGSDEDYQLLTEVYRNGDLYISIPCEIRLYDRNILYDWMHAVRVYPKQVTITIYTEEEPMTYKTTVLKDQNGEPLELQLSDDFPLEEIKQKAYESGARMRLGLEMYNPLANIADNHREALEKTYADAGISEDIDARLAFWKDDECSFSRNPTKELRLALHEQGFLVETFPKEFTFY